MKMQPISNLQIVIKNSIDVFYFSAVMPMHVFFAEDVEIDKRFFLKIWKEITEQNETQYQLSDLVISSKPNTDELCNKLRKNDSCSR